ncbi:ATP-binding protein [Sphaerisporangium sp. NPDC051017]|uniref:ATP-binding protein n=1 Tax=Sphaerisporangium sp. NPDC051017 TaxID=3154636 RepID=UPI0034276AC2
MFACRLKVDGSGASIAGPVGDFVGALAERAGLATRPAYWLRLAADEITTNIVQHGYRGRDGVVDLEGGVDADALYLRIEDDAPAFDPRAYDPAPRLAVPPSVRELGGYGLMLALGKVDEFRYQYVGGRNRNTLIMRLTTSGEAHGGVDAERAGGV